MKAKLEFDLPEEEFQFRCMSDGIKWYTAVWAMDNWLRDKIKHVGIEEADETIKAFELCRRMLEEKMENNDLYFNNY